MGWVGKAVGQVYKAMGQVDKAVDRLIRKCIWMIRQWDEVGQHAKAV